MTDGDVDGNAGLNGLIVPPFSRRGFVMTSLITGLTLATEPVEAQAITPTPPASTPAR